MALSFSGWFAGMSGISGYNFLQRQHQRLSLPLALGDSLDETSVWRPKENHCFGSSRVNCSMAPIGRRGVIETIMRMPSEYTLYMKWCLQCRCFFGWNLRILEASMWAHFSRQERSLEDFSCSLPSSKMNLESSSTNIDPHLI